ncbi:tyrosine-type recombinase/integrase [Salmonella enterica subsp. enterica serovar Chailey]|uniref:Tyrosine-type recombinase/integrase n=6 Tax=Salmonella enterica TaxID=28901 RepID=A0A7H0VLV5_SALET|nr:MULTISPECIES: tyrosine-type recombinase/integrase [Salmonella]EAA7924534.1 integrase [Salmonella enterica subsp. enterica serovar Kottbus]EAC0961545.1 integrase [Salmonella enterica subsp. enterica serovar Newport]EAP9826896.1 integrase [Salmonella enterica subsp. enterica serovar Chailey]EBF3551950.1 integrase [Salmonella enterica subsp. enterica serovar Kiambu]EBK7414295.1 integrase [Salmonella enterica subsp. enterica serovar Tennessee]EBO3567347.1 integrase [Salmonella enterica subsp. 
MSVRKLPSGEWIADFYTVDRKNGKEGKRVRKKFSTKGEALAFENYTLQKIEDSPWLGDGKDNRRLSDLVNLWFDRHGITLKDGEKRKSSMLWAAECMGSPLATEFSAQLFTAYRAKRLDGNFARTKRVLKVSPRTMNLEHAYFLAVFNELKRLGEWQAPNPLENVRQFRTDESEMAFLTTEQIELLLEECRRSSARDLEMVVKVCLATGARWSEAEKLKRSQIAAGKITFTKTKGKRNRTIPLDPEFAAELPKKNGNLFSPCYYAFRSALERAGIELPAGQLTHVLRHTFASHFMMNGGNILVLQKILGHTDIKMTMRYAHFAPNHLEEAAKLNPLKCLKSVAQT